MTRESRSNEVVGRELWVSQIDPRSSAARALAGYGIPHLTVRIAGGARLLKKLGRQAGHEPMPLLVDERGVEASGEAVLRRLTAISERPLFPEEEGRLLVWLVAHYFDEWVYRAVLHSRWRHRRDSEEAEAALGDEWIGSLPWGHQWMGKVVRRYQRGRRRAMGLEPENDDALEESMYRLLVALEELLSGEGPYLFGGHPTVADFTAYGALIQFRTDPTGRARLASHQAIHRYVDRMDAMAARPATVEVVQRPAVSVERFGALVAEVMATLWPLMIQNQRAQEFDRSSLVIELADGHRFRCHPTPVLGRRLEHVLAGIGAAYERQPDLFGVAGLHLERAVMDGVARLCATPGGRRLLRKYPRLAKR